MLKYVKYYNLKILVLIVEKLKYCGKSNVQTQIDNRSNQIDIKASNTRLVLLKYDNLLCCW